jgi:predicted nucleotidyltransferase
MDQGSLRQIAVQLRRALVDAGVPVDGVILFGSHSRKSAGPDSDIDLAVLSRAFGKDRFAEGALVTKYAHRIHPDLEAIPLALSQWFAEIQRDGIFLL